MAVMLNSSSSTRETAVSGAHSHAAAPSEAGAPACTASIQDGSLSGSEAAEVPLGATLVAKDLDGLDVYTCSDLAACAAIWKRFQEIAELTPFQRYEWLKHWYDCFAKGRSIEPYMVFVYDGGRLRLIAPLAVESGPIARRLIWLGHLVNDHNAPLADAEWLSRLEPKRAARLWQFITRQPDGIDYLHLIRHPSHLGAQHNPFLGSDPRAYSSNSHFLSLMADWPEFYQRLRGAKSRRRLREKAKRLGKVGKVRFRRVRGQAEVTAMIARLLAWKSDQLEGRGARNPFADGRLATQLFALANDAADGGPMRVYVLEIDNRPVAATVALVQGGTFNFYVPAYDDTGIRNCSPGTIMLVKLIELAARAGFAKFDFSLGDEAYKAEWCDSCVEITHQTEAITARGAVVAAVVRSLLDLKRRIKANDRLLSALEQVNAYRMALVRRVGVTADA
jgi:CelD/BcsL family acetyltransferase involved in cellulose biosynthesis